MSHTSKASAPDNSMGAFKLTPKECLPVGDMSAGVRADRAHPDGVTVHDLGRAEHGRCEYGRSGENKSGGYRVTALHLPSVNDSRGRLIRAHELLHAADTPPKRRSTAKYPQEVTNCCEDVDVHCIRWPRRKLGHLTRDALAVALSDVRAIGAHAADGKLEPGTCSDDDWNRAVAVMARSLAIIRGCHRGAQTVERRELTSRAAKRATDIVRTRFGPAMLSILTSDVLARIETENQRSHSAACASLQSLMRFPDDEADEGSPVDRNGDEEPTDEDENESGEKGGKEKAAQSPMRIERLPLLDACDPLRSGRGRSRRGARFNGPRLARAVASGSTVGLFIKNRQQSGGAVCIDASGSMRFNQESLTDLALAAPAAIVGYYAGHGKDSKRGHIGTLRIFAAGGKRSRTCPKRGGSNDVDLWAVRWLLRQNGPRVLVTDLGFCGGPDGQSEAAHAEVDRAVKSGALIVAPDVETAKSVFVRLKSGEAVATIVASLAAAVAAAAASA